MQTVLVTGGSRGIGAAICRSLALDGLRVIVHYNQNGEKAEALVRELTEMTGLPHLALGAELSDRAQVEELFRRAGPVDVLVNNAGIAQQKLFTDITEEDWERMFAVDVGGVFRCCQCALPHMIHQKSGAIVNVSSIWGLTGAACEVAYSAAKVFGGNPYLGAVIGMIMIHPNLQNAWTVASEGVQTYQPVFGGLYSIPLVGYQGHVIPVIIAVWLMSQIEKRLHKVVPAMFDLFVTPLVSVFVTGYLTLAVIGPIFTTVEDGIINGVQALIQLPYGIGSFVMGGLYAITVVAGIHHMYTLIDVGQLAKFGYTYWLPLASAANVAQGGAALAVALKSKDTKVKSMALPSALSACMGITEPAIFGVNLRYFKPFIGGLAGGACGALYASIVGLGATGTGVTGIFGILLHLHMPLQYIIMMAISFGVSFAVTWAIWSPEEVKA